VASVAQFGRGSTQHSFFFGEARAAMHEYRRLGGRLGARLLRRLLVVACLVAVGCQTAAPRREIRLWHQMRPEDRAVLAQRIAAFEAIHPEIRVRALYKETEELRSGLESAVLVGRGPEIVYGPSDVIGVYHAIGGVRDLRTWFTDEELAAFDPRALVALPARDDPQREALLMIGDRFGNHLALVYNRQLVTEPPVTTDELIALAQRETVDENGDGVPERYGLVWNFTEPFFAIPFLTGHGGWVFAEPSAAAGVRPTLDSPAMAAGYAFIAELRSRYGVVPPSADYEAAAALFLAGRAAFLIDGDWSWQRYVSDTQIDAAVAPLPIVSSTGLPMAPMVAPKGYSLTVAATGPAADDAAELIRFLTSSETQQVFLEQQKILPARLALRAAAAAQNDPTLGASLAQLERGRAMPVVTELRAVWDSMRPFHQQVLAGQLGAGDAVRRMQQRALTTIAAMSEDAQPDITARLVQLAGLALAGVLLAGSWKTWRELRVDLRRNPLAYAMAMPAVSLILLMVVFPLAYNVALSFSNMSLAHFRDWEIVGLHNYLALASGAEGSRFWMVFVKTIFWTVINVTLHVVLGVLLAVLLHGPVRGKSVYRVLLIIPWAVPAYITALTWRGMFDYQFGAVNHAIRALAGLNAYLPTALQIGPQNWLGEEGPALAACIVANVWLGFPFMMVIALGGLQGIPQELYEAARIDRANRWQQFWHITVPMLKPVMLPAITLGAVWTFNNLNVVWLVSNGGEPADKTHILVSYVYKAVFNRYQYGYGAALSMVIFLMLLAFSAAFLTRTRAVEAT
jgi:arabinogalactan oligomer/maltooligosaccharide transport system permease protein